VKLANEGLADFQRIRRWYVWPEKDFPRTSTQKPRANAIRDYVLSQLANSSAPTAPSGSLEELIGRVTGRPASHLKPESNLATDLQLSSIDRVELLSALEDRFQVDLNESKFSSATTVGELEAMLKQPVTRRSDYQYPRWARGRLISALRFIVYYLFSWPATAVMTRPRVFGRENLQGLKGPLLIICNHITQIDIGYVLYSLPFRYRHRLAIAMLGEMLQSMQHPPAEMGFWRGCVERLSYFLVVALFNVFPLPQLTGFRRSFAYAGECADLGFSLVVFPEGRRTSDGRLAPFQAGVGLLARKLDLPVVPVRIDGLFELKQKRKKLARPGTVRVRIGAPVRFEPNIDPESIARDLERRIREL
jgi:long-chain acyl-CoA synthetase